MRTIIPSFSACITNTYSVCNRTSGTANKDAVFPEMTENVWQVFVDCLKKLDVEALVYQLEPCIVVINTQDLKSTCANFVRFRTTTVRAFSPRGKTMYCPKVTCYFEDDKSVLKKPSGIQLLYLSTQEIDDRIQFYQNMVRTMKSTVRLTR